MGRHILVLEWQAPCTHDIIAVVTPAITKHQPVKFVYKKKVPTSVEQRTQFCSDKEETNIALFDLENV